MRGASRIERAHESRWWPVVLVLTLLCASLLPLLWDGRYYFRGDTQNAYLGWWFHLGESVRDGHWPVLDVHAWGAGNLVAEGQWGLFSPLTIGIGLLTSVTEDLVLLVTVIKIATILVSGTGTFVLARSYGAHRAAAYAAGVLVPLGGVTQFLEWPSWMNGQLGAALLPWFWWALRRTMIRGGNPWAALLLGYLIVTIGYVYGAIYVAIVLACSIGECALTRNRRGILRALLVGVVCGLVTVTVYLPGVLTAPVTSRAGWSVASQGSLQPGLLGLLSAALPLGPYGAEATGLSPQSYLAWTVPLLFWVDLGRIRGSWRQLSGLVLVLLVMVAWVLGPASIGPLRWPFRVMPVLALPAVVLGVVLVQRGVVRVPSRRRLALSVLFSLVVGYLTVSRLWEHRVGVLLGTGLVVAGTLTVWLCLRAGRDGTLRPLAVAAAALTVGVGNVGVVALQHQVWPVPPAVDRNSPRYASDYRTQLPTARGDVLVVGNPEPDSVKDPRVSRSLLIASAWYLNPHRVQNAYTTIKFSRYNSFLCMRYNGSTMCPRTQRYLVREEPRTDRRWLDLLSVGTVVLYRGKNVDTEPPSGWHVSDTDEWTVTWVRDTPVPPAGGVVWSSPGVRVDRVRSGDRDVSFRVVDAPASGGRVVLSRLPWPGYRISGASFGTPLQGRLMTVDLPDGARTGSVTVHFSPPGWRVEVACWWTAVGLALIWSVVAVLPRRRRRRRGLPE